MSHAFDSSLLLLRLPQFLRKSLPNQIFFLLPRPIFQIQATNAHPSRRTYMLHLDQPIVMLSDALQLAKSRSKLSGIGASTTHPRFRKGMDSRSKLGSFFKLKLQQDCTRRISLCLFSWLRQMSQKIALIVGAMLDDAPMMLLLRLLLLPLLLPCLAPSLPSFLSAMELLTLTSITNAYCAPHG